ncbi:kinesin-like protein Klp5 [Ascosphaera acerosa]|nr:kinesin-like protein Klp5 [Ascosphaera acerosa]
MLPNLASTASPAVPRLLNGSRVIVSPLKPAPSPRKRHMPVKKTRTSAVRKLDFEQTDSEREQRAGKKAKKRGVRWKDDIEEGKLVEFQQTPEKRTTPRLMPERSTPMKPVSAQNTVGAAPRSPSLPPLVEEDSSLLSPAPQASELPDTDTSFDRSISLPSAIPKRRSSSSSTESSTPLSAGAPSASQGGNSRGHTRAGYLSKRSFAGSLLSTPLSRQSLSAGSAGANKPPPLQGIGNIASLQRRISSSAFSQSSLDSIDEDSGLQVIKNEAKTINSALRRVSSAGASLLPQANRRRSSASAPTPPDENGGMFTLSQARRMVKGEKPSELKTSVLSPRSASITKGSKEHARARRSTTFADLRSMREAAASRSQETPLRLAPTGLPGSAAGRRRVSLAYPITARSMLR